VPSAIARIVLPRATMTWFRLPRWPSLNFLGAVSVWSESFLKSCCLRRGASVPQCGTDASARLDWVRRQRKDTCELWSELARPRARPGTRPHITPSPDRPPLRQFPENPQRISRPAIARAQAWHALPRHNARNTATTEGRPKCVPATFIGLRPRTLALGPFG
jgi:hypothetical protein